MNDIFRPFLLVFFDYLLLYSQEIHDHMKDWREEPCLKDHFLPIFLNADLVAMLGAHVFCPVLGIEGPILTFWSPFHFDFLLGNLHWQKEPLYHQTRHAFAFKLLGWTPFFTVRNDLWRCDEAGRLQLETTSSRKGGLLAVSLNQSTCTPKGEAFKKERRSPLAR